MGSASPSESLSGTPAASPRRSPALRLVAPAALRDLCAELLRARYVIARACPDGAWRGSLAAILDDAIEGALALRGALPPAVAVGADVATTIADQLLRVRALGAGGLAIVLPRLDESVDALGAMDAADSAVLRAWIAAGHEARVEVLVDDRDRSVGIFVPRALEELAVSEPVEIPAPAARQRQADEIVALEPSTAALAQEEPTLVPPRVEEKPTPSAVAAERVVSAAEWRALAVELDAARGPKPTAAIERLFATRYLPLLEAIQSVEVEGAVRDVVEEFSTSFEHSYTEGFATLRVTGKRPAMVLDAPDIAARVGRLNGARRVVLLLVDAMRFDLGERIAERVQRATAGRAVCVERSVLWSALPSTTPTQLALLGRGSAGLRDFAPSSEPEPTIERGRGVNTLRRERVGARDVMKLDLVEARLRNAGPPAIERLDTIADEAAPILVRFIESLPPRTLLYVFGDHGFRFPRGMPGGATLPAEQGGASPEEVLVPGYAWLVDGVH